MIIASIILGILLIIGGFSSMAAPLDTYLGAAKLLAILLFVYGIFAIVRFFKTRKNKDGLLVGILAVIIGFVYLFRPGDTPPAEEAPAEEAPAEEPPAEDAESE